MAKPQPATRIRTCRSCGKQFEYPIKGSLATRFHCEECIVIPPDIRLASERLFARIQKLEHTVKRLEAKVAPTSKSAVPPPQP